MTRFQSNAARKDVTAYLSALFSLTLFLFVTVLGIFLAGANTSAQVKVSNQTAEVLAEYANRKQRLLETIKKIPADSKLYTQLGVVQFYLGERGAAENSLRKAIELDPSNADARANLGYYYFQNGLEAAAADLLKQALLSDPDNFYANYYSALLAFQRQQTTRAALLIEKALSIDSKNLDARLDNIRFRVAQDPAAAERALGQLMVEYPMDSRVRYARAVLFASQARTEAAISEYKSVLTLAPASSGVYLELAVLYFKTKDYYHSTQMLREFHKTGVSPESAYLMGHSLAELGQMDEATGWLRKSLEGRSDLFDARFELGRIYFTKQQYDAAISEFRQAVSLQPANVETRYLLGYCLELREQPDAAMAQYTEILRLAPDRFEGYHGAGAVKLKQGDTDSALANLFRASRMNPRNADIQYLLGRAFARAGNNSSSIEHLRLAVTLDPSRVDAHYQLGLALKKAGLTAEADEQFKIAETLNAEFRSRGTGMARQPEP